MASSVQLGRNDVTVSAASKTITLAESGLVQNVTAATCTLTLPTGAAGVVGFVTTIRAGGSGATDGAQVINITPNASDLVNGNSFTAAAGKGIVITNQPGGSTEVTLQYGNTNNWFIVSCNNTLTRQP